MIYTLILIAFTVAPPAIHSAPTTTVLGTFAKLEDCDKAANSAKKVGDFPTAVAIGFVCVMSH